MQAYETVLSFSGMSGHAVVVEFDMDYRLVFWSEAQYAGCWDLGGDVWFTSEWLETNSPEDNQCYEPIMDKRLKYSHVEILESNDARVRVAWRYACTDLRGQVFHGNTRGEEIFTIYPDGVAVREVTLFPGDESGHGGNPNFWQIIEWITMIGTSTRPDLVFQKDPALLFMNDQDDSIAIQYPIQFEHFQPLCEAFPQVREWDMFIGSMRLVDRPNPFAIVANDQRLFPHRKCSHCGGGHPYFSLFSKNGSLWRYPSVNEDFVLSESGNDVIGELPVSASFIDGNYDMRPKGSGDRLQQRKASRYIVETPPPGTSWCVLTGANVSDPDSLRELATSWYHPAAILTGNEGPADFIPGAQSGSVIYDGYAYSTRSYAFRKYGVDGVHFTMNIETTIINPVFTVGGWRTKAAVVQVDGVALDDSIVSQAISGDELIVFLNMRIEKSSSVDIAEKS